MPRPISISKNPFRRGRPVTTENVRQDIEESFYDAKDEPEEFANRLKARFASYKDSGGLDINKPVPTPDDPYKTMRRGLKNIRPTGK